MCDTLVSLTDDGILFAKNSDRDPNEPQVLRWYGAAAHDSGDVVQCTWSCIPQVERTHAVLLSQPWWMWGAEMGANEHGVVIGNEAVFTRKVARGADLSTALLGMDLLRLALERATTAHDAVGVIVELLERHGQGGACSYEHPRFTYDNSFIVADPSGAVVLETAGRSWATEEVRAPGRSISNGLTIAGFADRHADPVRGRVAACARRRARTQEAAGRAAAPGDLMAALCDHGPGDHGQGSAPVWSRVNGALAAPCVHAGGRLTSTQTTGSWVSDLRSSDAIHWATGTSAPCTSVFKPLRVADPASVDPAAAPRNSFDGAYRWWRHELLHRRVLRDHSASVARFSAERQRLQAALLEGRPETVDAFDLADEAEARWLTDLRAADLPDRRPGWVRRLWRGYDAAAVVPGRGRAA